MKEEVKSESDILNMDEAENFFFKPKSKKEVMKILDIAEMQFANGEFTDSKVMEKDLAEEFKLKHNLLQPCIAQIKALYGEALHYVILYGSYARGEQRPDSDVDIMILVDKADEELLSYQKQLSFLTYDFNIDNETDIAPIQKSATHFFEWVNHYPFYKNVKEEGVVLFDSTSPSMN